MERSFFYTSGTNGFVDVRDVVNVMIQLMNGKIKSERFILCSESIPFKKTFDYIAEALGKKKPQIKVGPFLRCLRLENRKNYFHYQW